MTSTPSSHVATITATAAGVVSGAVGLVWGVSYWLQRRQERERTESPTSTWTAPQVATWLRENGVSKASVSICRRYKVDGSALARLTSQDLYRMGVPLRDARIILACIEDVKDGPVLSCTSPHQSIPPTQHTNPGIPSSVEQFGAAWRALVRTCGFPEGAASPAEQQQRLALYTGALLECFQALDASEQAAALSLLAVAEKVPPLPSGSTSHEVQSALAKSPASVDALFPTQAVEEKLKPLHQMLDGFLEFLRSPELVAVGSAELEELGERVAVQVKRISRVAEQLPPNLSRALLLKCNSVFEALSRHTQPKLGKETTDKVRLMRVLQDILTTLGDPKLRELPAAQRVQVLSTLAERARTIEAAASSAGSGVSTDMEFLSMVRSLIQMIEDATLASKEEAGGNSESPAGDEDEKGKAMPTEDTDAANGSIPLIVRTVKDIQGTLQSEEFQHAPSAVKLELCTTLLQRVTLLERNVAALPSPAQGMVRDLLSNTRSVLAVITAAAETGEGISREESKADDRNREDGQGSAKAAGSDEAGGESQDTDVDIEACVLQLEKIFDFLASDTLERATQEERQNVAARLMQQVEMIKEKVAEHDSQGTLMTELIEPLQELLSTMAGHRVPSPEFIEMTAPLNDVRRLLASESFRQIPTADKVRIARSLVPQLQQISSSFSSLSDAECMSAGELMRPIRESLMSVLRATDSATGSAEVLDRLQAVVRTIRGSGLTDMSPSARSAWAASTVTELDQLRHDCVPLGAEGEALVPIIERLRSQISGLLVDEKSQSEGKGAEDSGDAAPTGNGNSKEAQQQPGKELVDSVWAQIFDMRAELLAAEKTASPVPLERVQGMLRVVREAARQPGMSLQQEEALQELGGLLRRQMESKAKHSGGVAEGNGDGQTDQMNTVALHAFRRSLQVLVDMVSDVNVPTATQLTMVASKAEELIASADASNMPWREDTGCAHAVQSILEALQKSRASEDGNSCATEPNSLEAVLQSSIAAIHASSPTDKEGFAPYMRLLQLAHHSTEQMTNKELILLKNLQEAVIGAMQRLPRQSDPISEKNGQDRLQKEEEEEEEEGEEGNEEDGDEDANHAEGVLSALLQLSHELRERSFSVEELDQLEGLQKQLERLLAHEGVDATDSIKAIREQICLQRNAIQNDKANSLGSGEEEFTRLVNKKVGSEDSRVSVQPTDKQVSGSLQPDSADAFNEDDDDDGGVSGGAATISGFQPNIVQHAAGSGDIDSQVKA